MSYTIGQLAGEFGISRSSLLYYDRKGLLSPTSRTRSNYRSYSDKDHDRLAKIMAYRNTGLSLAEIAELLEKETDNRKTRILEQRLNRLNTEIAGLRKQQQVIIQLLVSQAISHSTRAINKKQWVDLLASTGMSEEDMGLWHREFEHKMPDAHQDFLESLNISPAEIRQIRKRAQM